MFDNHSKYLVNADNTLISYKYYLEISNHSKR